MISYICHAMKKGDSKRFSFRTILTTQILGIFFVCSTFQLYAQSYQANGFSFGLSANITLGCPINKIGFNLGLAYRKDFAVAHAGSNFDYNFTALGTRKHFVQSKNTVGLQFYAGKKNGIEEIPIYTLNRLSTQQFGLGYTYIWFLDNTNSSQRSGAFSLFIERTRIYFENDIFAGQGSDRFRTGSVFVQYSQPTIVNHVQQLTHFQLGINLWTGNTRGVSSAFDSTQNCTFKNLCHSVYGKTSHGIFYIGVAQQITNLHQLGAKIGIDSEVIRNGFQNKLFHDLSFIPSTKVNRTANYPMLDKEGNPTFSKANRRKDRLFFIGGLNLD